MHLCFKADHHFEVVAKFLTPPFSVKTLSGLRSGECFIL